MAVVSAGLIAAPASAGAKSKETYIFLVWKVGLENNTPKELSEMVATRLRSAIDAHKDIEPAVPQGAPDPDKEPEKFSAYLKARKMRAFKMNVQVTRYSQEIEPGPNAGSQYVTVRVSLRLFAESYPARGLSWTGDGSATVKIETGKTVRDADKKEANSAALDEAVKKAIDQVLVKLREPPPSAKKKKKG
ncbi:MAG TPA: hypothetical protein VFU21_22815 [Kofleriaceae bacterium]|nr:hypothetical protein [Kofleriaceae bacterium]